MFNVEAEDSMKRIDEGHENDMYYEISDSILLCFMQKKSMMLPLDYMNSKTRMSKEGRPSEMSR